MLTVVPDTNLLFSLTQPPRSPSSSWAQTLQLSATGDAELVLPELVQWELANQLREKLDHDLDAYRAALRSLRRDGISIPGVNNVREQADHVVARFADALRTLVLEHGGTILPIIDVAAPQLALRSLERRPPFDDRDRGMRDTLLWLTVLELARAGRTVVLASNDARAFGDQRLHQALEDEVVAVCGDPNRVLLARSLHEANTLVEQHATELRRTVERLLSRPAMRRELAHRIAAGAEGLILSERSLRSEGWTSEVAGIRIIEVLGHRPLSLVSTAASPDGARLRAVVDLPADAELDARHEMEITDEECLLLCADGVVHDSGIGLLDNLIQVSLERDAVVRATAVFERGSQRLVSVTVEDARVPRRTPHDRHLRLAA